jgi:RsmE family RNA methyltransferase
VGLDREPPPPSPVTLVLALPRPPMLRRVLQTIATCGVKSVHLVHARRVEKSFWQSSALKDADVEEQLILGLEQGRDTVLPRVEKHARFRPFAEDVLPGLLTEKRGFLADGSAQESCPSAVTEATVLAVGPEGGFVEFERTLLERSGMRPVRVGARPLRVDVAVAALLGRLA